MLSILLFLLIFSHLNAENKAQKLKAQNIGKIETPAEHFGFEPGADRMLFDYEELIDYLQKLDNASTRLKLTEIGNSPMGKKMYIAFISSEKNIKSLNKLKDINRKLALNPNIPEPNRDSLLNKGKVFFLATLSMHSDEIGPSQSAPLVAYDLVTTEDSQKREWLDNVVLMMVPCHNPDGMNMVVNNYKKYKGTKYEGTQMPGIYHKYTGHDNNRDFITLTQEDNRNIARIYNKDWFPQIMVEKHQMFSNSVRYSVPPAHDPIAENIDAGIWNWSKIIGANIATDLTKQGLHGISQNYFYDEYAPFFSSSSTWKNVTSFLTEAASVKYATPIFIEPTELKGYGKGLSEYKKSINMPSPWPGGWWRLSDIVSYEKASIMSVLKTASLHRHEILKFRNDLCIKEVSNGKTIPPYYYIIPLKQHDESEFVNLVHLLKQHGVHIYQLNKPVVLDEKTYQKGDIIIPLSQPFRPFIKEVLERQKFPVRHYTPGGKVIKPYDATSWSLPLHMGVKVDEIKNPYSEVLDSAYVEIKEIFKLVTEDIPHDFEAAVFTVQNNESFKAAFLGLQLGLKVARLTKAANISSRTLAKGSFIIYNNADKISSFKTLIDEINVPPIYISNLSKVESSTMKIPKIALVESWLHDMDAGWTRFIFDSYHLPFKTVRPGDFEKTDFTKDFDVVVFPNNRKSVLMSGKIKTRSGELIIPNFPPEYTKGIGKKGMTKLMSFAENGGIIISWGNSSNLFQGILEIKQENNTKEEFQLPYKNISKILKTSGLYCPGSILKIDLLNDHPITLGMKSETGIFYNGGPVFATSIPNFDMDRRVIGKFPEKNILLSGYCEKEEVLSNKTCLVWLKKGKGQLVLFGFNPQFRASTNTSFKLLFNSILLSKIND
ncbi:zinc carboxypeptidase [Marinifilum flexuosum]|uniref:Zinc carboxypeptidase n=2 Tax=Marinifilum flexuosum TaxID=1117708 RepID=A0A419X3A6_9BACT|nr:zinc carboxypeptidase [Marinifilum flexuosum]